MQEVRRDNDLLELWRGGDKGAGLVLFRRYFENAQRFFMNKVSTGVGEMVFETFEACGDSRDRTRNRIQFRAYLFRIAYHVLLGRFRNRAQAVDGQIDFESVASFELSPGPSTLLVRNSEQRLLTEGLRRISVVDQVILELYYWEQLPPMIIGQILDFPSNTVKQKVRRARHRLKRKQEQMAHSPETILTSTLSDLDRWPLRSDDC